VLAKNEEVVVEMGLARREVPNGQTGRGHEQVPGAISVEAMLTGNDFIIVGHSSSNESVNQNGASDRGA